MAKKKKGIIPIEKAKKIEELNKKYGNGTIQNLGGPSDEQKSIPRIPTGSVQLDHHLVGGYPRGRIIEIYGVEGAGKTSLAMLGAATAQKHGISTVMGDAEHALDPDWVLRPGIGVDLGSLDLVTPDNGNEMFDIAVDIVRNNLYGYMVIDSVAALVPKEEVDGTITQDEGGGGLGLHARLMSAGLRQLTGTYGKNSDTTTVFINQIRNKIGVMFGSPETTTGGNALKFYSSVRLEVRKGGLIGEDYKEPSKDNPVIGQYVVVKVVKNKTAPPHRHCELAILHEIGFDIGWDYFAYGWENNVITLDGSWYQLNGKAIAQGKGTTIKKIREDEEVQRDITAAIKGEAPVARRTVKKKKKKEE